MIGARSGPNHHPASRLRRSSQKTRNPFGKLRAEKPRTFLVQVCCIFKFAVVPHPIAGGNVKGLFLARQRLEVVPHLAPNRSRVKKLPVPRRKRHLNEQHFDAMLIGQTQHLANCR